MSIQELMAQRAELDRQIADSKAAQTADCVQRAFAVFTDAGFTNGEALDVLRAHVTKSRSDRIRRSRKPVGEPRYRNIETGATWTGRGVKPKWFKAGYYVEV